MATTLQEVIGYRNLCGIITDPKGGVPSDILPPTFSTLTRNIQGDTGTYVKVDGTRRTARIANKGQPSMRRQLKGISDKPFKLIPVAEHVMHDADVLIQLRNYDNEAIQRLGVMEVARQTAICRQYVDNLRVSMIYSVLTHGAIYYDGDGNLLPSSSGAAVTVDFAVPAGNKDQLDVDGTGDIIDASWATDGTNILGHLIALKKAARKLTGYRLKYAFYGDAVLDYISTNDTISEYMSRNERYQNAFAAGEFPDPFLGLTWRPAYEAFFEDNDGTNQDWWSNDTVVFSPEPDPTWWEFVQGTTPVPRGINIAADAIGAAGDIDLITGRFSYAELTRDPVGIKQVYGDLSMPIPKVPGAYFIADTNF